MIAARKPGNYFDRVHATVERDVPVQSVLGQPQIGQGVQVHSLEPLRADLAPVDWAYGIVVKVLHDALKLDAEEVLVLRWRIAVAYGDVRIGCLDSSMQNFVNDDLELWAQSGEQEADVVVPPEAGYVVIRTGLVKAGAAPYIEIRDVRAFIGKPESNIAVVEVEAAPEALRNVMRCPPSIAKNCEFDIFLTHSTRRFDMLRGSAAFIKERYSRSGRLLNLPPFETFEASTTSHYMHGAMTLFRLSLKNDGSSLREIRCIDSREQIGHVAMVGGKVVICCVGFLCVLPSLDYHVSGSEFDPGSPFRIDDPWFAGLHTVVTSGPNECLVSASGPDAVLWVDVDKRRVTRRMRLPADIYGTNYALAPDSSVHEHYIPNDYQLAHLNSAFPDGNGGAYISTLGQGDVGHFNAAGDYRLLASGHIGIHGVRRSIDDRYLYFAESCSSQLWKLAGDGPPELMMKIDAKWVHDALQLSDELFACTLVDTNQLLIVDISGAVEVARFDLGTRGSNPQFLTLLPA